MGSRQHLFGEPVPCLHFYYWLLADAGVVLYCHIDDQPRVVLLLLVALAMHTTFVVEQPHGSLLPSHARWDWFMNRVCKAS